MEWLCEQMLKVNSPQKNIFLRTAESVQKMVKSTKSPCLNYSNGINCYLLEACCLKKKVRTDYKNAT